MKFEGRTNEFLELLELNQSNKELLADKTEGQLSLLWFQDDQNELIIDSQRLHFKKNQIICLTSFHEVHAITLGKAHFIRFNAPFYCILNHDSEVGCKGILFFGAKHLPVLIPEESDLDGLNAVWNNIKLELGSKDELQLEMLQMMLKRLLILTTRIYKRQEDYVFEDEQQLDIIREFNFLVEMHFKQKHSVSEYAELLNKSPKTLSNLFGKASSKSPLQFIQDRLMLEARRQLRYTDVPISEVGYDIGFNDIQSFSRFFRKNEGRSPSDFRLN